MPETATTGGSAAVGYYLADGEPIHLPAGGVLVVGRLGSGKTTLAVRLAHAARQRGEEVWAAHGTNVGYRDVATRTGSSPAQAAVLLADAAAAGLRADPSGGRAGLLLVVEDADRLVRDEGLAGMLRTLAAAGPDTGITVVATTSEPGPELLDMFATRVCLPFPCTTLASLRFPGKWVTAVTGGAVSGRDAETLPIGSGFVIAPGMRADAARFLPPVRRSPIPA